MSEHDELVAQVRDRAADPARRRDQRDTVFGAHVASLDLGQLLSETFSLQADLGRIVQEGGAAVGPEMRARLDDLATAMATPAETVLPEPATAEELDAAEAALGFALPPLLRRLLAEVANGGFGPGEGLLGVGGGWTDHGRDLVGVFEVYREGPFEAWDWPERTIPLCHLGDGVFAFVDAGDPAAPVVEWDEELDYDDEEGPGGPDLTPISPSLTDWVQAWLDGG